MIVVKLSTNSLPYPDVPSLYAAPGNVDRPADPCRSDNRTNPVDRHARRRASRHPVTRTTTMTPDHIQFANHISVIAPGLSTKTRRDGVMGIGKHTMHTTC